MSATDTLMLKKNIIQFMWEDYIREGWPYDVNYSEIGVKWVRNHLYIGVKDDDIASGMVIVIDLVSFISGDVLNELRYFFNQRKQYIAISKVHTRNLQNMIWEIKNNICEGEIF